MIKSITLAKRKPGMSLEAFREYYETRHAPLAVSLFPRLRRYQRNYLTPVGGVEGPFDVVIETWFDSEAERAAHARELAASPETQAAIAADEENLFDRSTITFFRAEEVASQLGGA